MEDQHAYPTTLAFQSESIGELAKALAAAQGEMQPAKKDQANPFFKSRYADLASCWDAARQPLTKNNLSVVQTTQPGTGGAVIIESILLHGSGEWIKGWLEVTPAKTDPQSLGSAITYGRRYGFMALVGIAPDDDDGESAMGRKQGHGHQGQQATPPSPPQQAQAGQAAMASEAQVKKINILIRELGIEDRAAKIERLNKWLASTNSGRSVNSTSELTQREASALIEQLSQRQEQANV